MPIPDDYIWYPRKTYVYSFMYSFFWLFNLDVISKALFWDL